jgi:nucleotide-binding universal stress UspA family protein
MSEPNEESVLGRILVVLDASPFGLEALEAAAKLAVQVRAELRGLFVEDIDLLRLAALPFAREVATFSAQRRLDVATMERTLRANAERARRAVAKIARRQRVPWSFEVLRGAVARATLAAAAEGDTTIIGCESRSLRTPVRPARRPPRPRVPPILVVYDGTRSARRALAVAEQLAEENAGQVIVLIAASDHGEAQRLERQSLALLQERGRPAAAYEMPVTDASMAAAAARILHARILLLNRDSALLDEAAIETLINHLDCPVVIV